MYVCASVCMHVCMQGRTYVYVCILCMCLCVQRQSNVYLHNSNACDYTHINYSIIYVFTLKVYVCTYIDTVKNKYVDQFVHIVSFSLTVSHV